MSKKISVIVPVYNVDEGYLEKCIESVLGQDYSDVELLLIDDGSTNGAPAICDRFAKEDERVISLHQENAGVSVARNNGLDHATGDYIVFVDGDDYLSDGAFTDIMKHADKEEYDILFFGYCTNYTNREINRVMTEPDMSVFKADDLSLAILQGDARLGMVEVGAPWGKLIRRSVIEDNGVRYTKGLKKGQDTVFTLHLLIHCDKIGYAPVAGYHYRMSTSSISHRFNENIVEIMEKTLGAYEQYVKDAGRDEVFKSAVDRKYYKVILGEYCDLYFMNKRNPKSAGVLNREMKALTEREPYRTALGNVDTKRLHGLERIEVSLLKGGCFSLLRIEKKLLNLAKWILIRNYD